jgi:multidrug efflux pump subunit AcrA (membrane-fusion protein)
MAASKNKIVSVATRVLVCIALLGGAVIVYRLLASSKPKPAPADLHGTAPRIIVMQARPMPIRRQWEGFGTAVAMDSSNVPARVTSTVIARAEEVRPGQPVARGQILVRLDESDFARQVEIASHAIKDIDAQLLRLDVEEQGWTRRAELAAQDVRLANADYDRVRQAFETQAAKQRELDQAQQALNTAQRAEVAAREELDKVAPRRASLRAQRLAEDASLRLASQNVERSQIVSPIDGILQAVDVEVGENVTAGQRVARVVNIARIEIPLRLPASARSHVDIGDEVMIRDSGAGTRRWTAQVIRIGPEDDQSTRTMQVYIELRQESSGSNGRDRVAPGEFVQGVVVSGEPQQRWVVPRRAIDSERIMVIEEGRVRTLPVEADFTIEAEVPKLGLADRQWTVLKQPLPRDALVVVDGSDVLAEGSAATPVIVGETAVSLDRGDDKEASP